MKRIYRFDTETQYNNTVVNLPSVSFTDDSTSNFYDMSEPHLRIVFDKGNDKIIYFPNGVCDLDLTSSGVYNNGTSGSNPLKLYFNRVKKVKGGIYYDGIKEVYIDRYLEKINYQDANNETWCNATDIIYVSPDNQHYISNENSCIVERSTNKLIGGTKNVVIPNYVTTIGYGAFIDIDFDEFIIPNSVITIEEEAFYNCSANKISIGNNLVNIHSNTCKDFFFSPNISGTAKVLEIDTLQHFYNLNIDKNSDQTYYLDFVDQRPLIQTYNGQECISFEEMALNDQIYLPNDNRLTGCLTLEYIALGEEDIPDTCFEYCSNLKYVFFNCSAIEIIGKSAFEACTQLNTLVFDSYNSNLKTIDAAAFCNTAVTVVDLSSITSLTSLSTASGRRGVFQNCTLLTEVKLPLSITYIGSRFVQGCTSLQKVTINAITPPTITTYTWADSNNCLIYVPDASVNTYKAAQYWSAIADRIKPISELTT